MLKDPNKINSLVKLIEDPDEEVYESIRNVILECGESIIPVLESHWEKNPLNSMFQERAENLIHQIQFEEVQRRLLEWKTENQNDYLQGFLILNRYQFPDVTEDEIIDELMAMAMELQQSIFHGASTRQRIEVLNHLFFSEWGFKGNKQNMQSPQNSYISEVLGQRKGNPLTLSAIYLYLAKWAEIPLVGVNMPRYFLVGAYDNEPDNELIPDFFIDIFGKGFEVNEMELRTYLMKMNIVPKHEHFLPAQSIEMVLRCLNNLINAYAALGYEEKVKELLILTELLSK